MQTATKTGRAKRRTGKTTCADSSFPKPKKRSSAPNTNKQLLRRRKHWHLVMNEPSLCFQFVTWQSHKARCLSCFTLIARIVPYFEFNYVSVRQAQAVVWTQLTLTASLLSRERSHHDLIAELILRARSRRFRGRGDAWHRSYP